MPFTLRYNALINSEESVTKSKIKAHNVYRIESYKYADGTTKSLLGTKSALIFVLEIKDRKVLCLKISEVDPKKFFQSLKLHFNRGLSEEKFNNSKRLNEILVKSKIINKKIPFRSYNLDGMKKIDEIYFKKEVLKSYY
jgi:hypothetical protein